MDALAGLKGTYLDGVFFTEEPAEAVRLSVNPIRVELSRQNANLRQVKTALARQVTAHGGNALVGFTYGQKSHGVLAQVFTFKWDTESWHGAGFVARL